MELLEKTSTAASKRFFRYNHSPKGIIRNYKYRATEKRREHERHYNKVRCLRQLDYKRELYQRMQDEAGLHIGVNRNYFLFRFLKALEYAEVVEIK